MKFNVFKGTKGLIIVSESGDVFEGNISPIQLKQVTYFEADGVSDFNYGMVNILLKYGEDSAEKEKAERISKEGL